jgi:hypothetical protein
LLCSFWCRSQYWLTSFDKHSTKRCGNAN